MKYNMRRNAVNPSAFRTLQHNCCLWAQNRAQQLGIPSESEGYNLNWLSSVWQLYKLLHRPQLWLSHRDTAPSVIKLSAVFANLIRTLPTSLIPIASQYTQRQNYVDCQKQNRKFGIYRRVVRLWTYISEVIIAYIFRVKNQLCKTECNRWSGDRLALLLGSPE